ncbi:unnamed protein product, partial [marine sediment metagenome]
MPIGPDEWEAGDIAGGPLPELPYKLVTHKECKCCAHKDVQEIDEAFLRDFISGQEAAERLGVSPAYYSTHINRDILRPAKEIVANSPVVKNVVNDTLGIVTRMRNSLNRYMDRLDLLLDQGITERTEFRIKAISSEVRAWSELLLKLEGQLQDSPLIVIQNMEVRFQKVIETVM